MGLLARLVRGRCFNAPIVDKFSVMLPEATMMREPRIRAS